MHKSNGYQSPIDVPEDCHGKKHISIELKVLTRSRKRTRFLVTVTLIRSLRLDIHGWRLQLAKRRNDWSVRKINVVAQVHCKIKPMLTTNRTVRLVVQAGFAAVCLRNSKDVDDGDNDDNDCT